VIKLPLADVAEARIAKTVRLIEQAGGKAQAISAMSLRNAKSGTPSIKRSRHSVDFKRVSRYRVVDA
jgi:hypothetical protein